MSDLEKWTMNFQVDSESFDNFFITLRGIKSYITSEECVMYLLRREGILDKDGEVCQSLVTCVLEGETFKCSIDNTKIERLYWDIFEDFNND